MLAYWWLILPVILIWAFRRMRVPKDDMWDGPTLTEDAQKSSENWVVDHLIDFGSTSPELTRAFPKAADKAKAVNKYEELNKMLSSGKINQEQYEAMLDEILPLIDISDDINIL